MPVDPKSSERKVLCPECEAETTLNSEGEGFCPKCSLDVGWVLEKARRERAVRRVNEARDAESKPPKKKGWGDF